MACTFRSDSQPIQFRVTDSLKFNSSVATCAQAACSAGGIGSSRGDSPTARYSRAAASFAGVTLPLALQRAGQNVQLRRRRRPRDAFGKRPLQPFVVRSRMRPRSARRTPAPPRRTARRSAAPAPAAAWSSTVGRRRRSRDWARRTPPCSAAARSASNTCRASGDTASRRDPARTSAPSPACCRSGSPRATDRPACTD